MSAFMHDVARASLPVAIALLAFTGVARAALWADDPTFVRLGRQYLEPLSTWCLGAVAVQLFAVVAAGDAGALSLFLPIAMGAAAVLLRPSEEATAAPEPAAARRKASGQVHVCKVHAQGVSVDSSSVRLRIDLLTRSAGARPASGMAFTTPR